MKKYLIMLIIPFMMMSCAEDMSAYLPQEKENVNVDETNPDDGGGQEPEAVDGILTPGIHTLKLTVGGVERKFKYFMPVSIVASMPITLLFDFHSAIEIKEDAVGIPDPIEGIAASDSFNQLAIKENAIVVYPAGLVHEGVLGWAKDNYAESILFVDAMIAHFKRCTPLIDANYIYATGYGDGAALACVLSRHRSEVFAAIAPIAGMRYVKDDATASTRGVPMIMMVGEVDGKPDPNSKLIEYNHSDLLEGVDAWAVSMGYFEKDVQVSEEPFEVDKYNKKVDTRKYLDGRANIEMFTIKEVKSNSISMLYMGRYIWDFFKLNVLNVAQEKLYISARDTAFVAECNQKIEIPFSYTDGADFTVKAPDDWSPRVDNNIIYLTAPATYNTQNVVGNIVISITKNGKSKTFSIAYKLNPPKSVFEVGDIYYNTSFEPVGVVAWVNPKNRAEAKIINFDTPGAYGTIHFNTNLLGADFETPSKDDGEGNTQLLLDKNNTIEDKNDATSSAYVWASEYSYNGVSGWYLPAINELVAVGENIKSVNSVLTKLGAKALSGTVYSSTVEVVDVAAGTKNFYFYDLTKAAIVKKLIEKEYTAYNSARAMKAVKK